MSYEENRRQVINEIAEAIKYSLADGPIKLNPIHEIGQQKMNAIILQLEAEDVLKVIRIANDDAWRLTLDPYIHPEYYTIEIRERQFFLDSEETKSLEIDSKSVGLNKEKETNVKSVIIYSEDRSVILNGDIELSRTNFNSENDIIFGFLYKNPNETFLREDLEKECKIKITKSLSKTVENLGFCRGLKKVFFDVSKNSIRFNNPGKILKTL